VTPRRLRVSDDPALTTHANHTSGIDHIDMDSQTVYLLMSQLSAAPFDPTKTHHVNFVFQLG
jgi:hypothetical protein